MWKRVSYLVQILGNARNKKWFILWSLILHIIIYLSIGYEDDRKCIVPRDSNYFTRRSRGEYRSCCRATYQKTLLDRTLIVFICFSLLKIIYIQRGEIWLMAIYKHPFDIFNAIVLLVSIFIRLSMHSSYGYLCWTNIKLLVLTDIVLYYKKGYPSFWIGIV